MDQILPKQPKLYNTLCCQIVWVQSSKLSFITLLIRTTTTTTTTTSPTTMSTTTTQSNIEFTTTISRYIHMFSKLSFQKLSFSLIRRWHRLTPTRDVQLFRSYLRCLWIDLDVLRGFATQNLIKKPFLMFLWHFRVFRGRGLILSDFRELSFCGPSEPCFLLRNIKTSLIFN